MQLEIASSQVAVDTMAPVVAADTVVDIVSAVVAVVVVAAVVVAEAEVAHPHVSFVQLPMLPDGVSLPPLCGDALLLHVGVVLLRGDAFPPLLVPVVPFLLGRLGQTTRHHRCRHHPLIIHSLKATNQRVWREEWPQLVRAQVQVPPLLAMKVLLLPLQPYQLQVPLRWRWNHSDVVRA